MKVVFAIVLLLHVDASNIESDEQQEVKRKPPGYLLVGITELREYISFVGEASKEEGETANDQIGTN